MSGEELLNLLQARLNEMTDDECEEFWQRTAMQRLIDFGRTSLTHQGRLFDTEQTPFSSSSSEH